MTTRALTKSELPAVVGKKGIVLIDFWAEWCGPCRNFAPVYEEASERHADIVFAKVDTDAERALAQVFSIQSIPTLVAFKDGVPVLTHSGMMRPRELEELVRKVRETDVDAMKKALAGK